MNTGKNVPVPASMPWSGVTVSVPPESEALAGACSTEGPGPLDPEPPAAESHTRGAETSKASPPSESVAITFPAEPALSVNPGADSPRLNVVRFAAACALFTTSARSAPWSEAVTCRSTPGTTPGYVAVSPDTVGAGSAPAGHVTASVPPPQESSCHTVTTGAPAPSDCAWSVVSMSAHVPSESCTRCCVADTLSVKLPSGFTNVCANSVRSDSASTGCALDWASASAVGSSAAIAVVLATAARACPVNAGRPANTIASVAATASLRSTIRCLAIPFLSHSSSQPGSWRPIVGAALQSIMASAPVQAPNSYQPVQCLAPRESRRQRAGISRSWQLPPGSHTAAEAFSSRPVPRVGRDSRSVALGDGGDGHQEDDHGDRQGQSNQDPSNHPRTSICLICASTRS